MKTPTITRATRRLAASIAIITALATSGAWAANITWTGATDNDAGTGSNWSANRFPNNDDAIFNKDSFDANFSGNVIVFNSALTNNWRSLVRNVGSEANPLIFRATSSANGMQFGNNSSRNNEFGYNTGDAYLRLENGTWSTGVGKLYIGGSSTSGQLTLAGGASFSVGDTLTLQNGELNLTDGATFSAGNTLTLQNGELNLTGGSTFSTGSTLTIANGELNLTDDSTFSVGGALTITNGVLNLTDGSTFSTASGQSIYLYNDASKMTISGDSTLTGGKYFCLRAGEVTVENGTLKNTSKAFELGQDAAVTLNLNEGGVLEASQITDKTNGGTVMFNGGEIKAASNALISDSNVIIVKVGTLGGAVNANSRNVTFDRPIAADGANDGGMTFKGGGSVSLKYANTYTGATKVELGTKIIATTADAKNSVLANLVVTGVAADGDYTVFEYGDGLSSADLANVSCPDGAEGTTISLGAGNTSIVVHYVAPADLGWNGGNAAWATANAWTNATGTAKTWSDGNYAVFATGDTVTLGADVAAVSVTFNADATIAAGGGTLTVPVVDVGSGVFATIAAPTAGALEKTGAGTLTLGSSRAGTTTTLTEGTLVANAPVGTLTLGTDATKPVTFDYGGGTYATLYTLDNGLNVTLTNCTFTSFSRVANGTVHVAKGATAWISSWLTTGPGSELTDTAAVLDICGGVVSNVTRNVSLGDNGELGATSEVRVRNGGLFTTGNKIIVGARAAATLTIDDGSVIVPEDVQFCQYAACKLKENCFVNLNAGGLLTARSITYGDGAANATFTFNGGTLKANQDYTLIVNKERLSVVTATSGTIDADGHAVTIAKAISGAGGMTYQGGGSVTLSAAPTYAGVTTVEVGTTLVVPAAIAGDKLAFTVPGEIADGVYTVVSISGDSQFADDVLDGKGDGFVLSDDKKKICYVKGMDTSKPIYVGTDGNLSAAGNWLDGTVPKGGTGEAQVFCATAATLMVGDTFAPAKLVIPGGSALVTIGSGTLCVGEIENRQLLAVGTGATVVIGNQLTLAKGESLCYQNYGTLVVSNLLLKAEKGDRYVTENQAASVSGVFKFGTVTNSMTDNWLHMVDRNDAVTPYEFYIGEGGLNFLNASGTAGYSLGLNTGGNSSTTIRPWHSNFTIADRGTGNKSLILHHNITFCTDDESGEGRTITIGANTRGHRSPVITVSGKGTLQVNGTCENSDEPVVTVTDSATLAFGEGATLGTGAITLGTGTKLVLTQPSGSNEFTPLDNTLNLPTEGTATIRIDGARLSSGYHTILSNVTAGATANVNLDMTGTALDGRKASLAVDGSNLVLTIVSPGLSVFVR